MARPRRVLIAGAYYHVTTRGNNGRPIVADDGDRAVFVHILNQVQHRYHWRVHAWCLMGNHYHLVVETPEPNLSAGMRDLNGGYARSFNDCHGRKDHLFGRRYHAVLIESDEQ
jgi:REP element-mobilizing transposase RayT